MSNYTHIIDSQDSHCDYPDMWAPFSLRHPVGSDHDYLMITPLNDRSDIPYADMCYAQGQPATILEHDNNWNVVDGLNARNSDIYEPAEYINYGMLESLEDGIYQTVFVEMMSCDDCEEFEECDCDLVIGWALMKLEVE